MRYFYHPESDSLWQQEESLTHSDGLVEELSKEEYEEMVERRKTEDSLLDDMAILQLAAEEIGSDPRPYKDVREAFRTFAKKVHRMRMEAAEARLKHPQWKGPTYGGKRGDLDDEITF